MGVASGGRGPLPLGKGCSEWCLQPSRASELAPLTAAVRRRSLRGPRDAPPTQLAPYARKRRRRRTPQATAAADGRLGERWAALARQVRSSARRPPSCRGLAMVPIHTAVRVEAVDQRLPVWRYSVQARTDPRRNSERSRRDVPSGVRARASRRRCRPAPPGRAGADDARFSEVYAVREEVHPCGRRSQDGALC